MGIPMRQGREFGGADTADSPRTIVINESMARRYWPQGNALGGRVRIGPNQSEVIGIAADAKYNSISERPTPQIYLPLALDPNLPVFDARTVTEHLQTAVFAQRMAANLLGAMGVLALLLAAIGLYGVMAYAVSQRTQEMGIRLALGASPGSLLGMIVGQGMKLAVVGLAIGLVIAAGAFGSIGAMRSLLPGISPLDPITFVAVPAVLGLIALAASWIPARRAGRVDPLVALRYE
ncbi:MAG: hypothetical protein A3J29_01435 [Acidobacteria bacterium RIFCSPLOWO2_12_FULL_67_14b]|nr:MAG: hypothetical protein A3J29_01435 [Acidobacteria bacterium RIFCSPLOWO2_12_FULL_67_14b]